MIDKFVLLGRNTTPASTNIKISCNHFHCTNPPEYNLIIETQIGFIHISLCNNHTKALVDISREYAYIPAKQGMTSNETIWHHVRQYKKP